MIGFAAETEHLIDHARAKLKRKGCDWLVANDVSPSTGVMGGDRNTVHLLTRDSDAVDSWPVMTKEEVAAHAGGADRGGDEGVRGACSSPLDRQSLAAPELVISSSPGAKRPGDPSTG